MGLCGMEGGSCHHYLHSWGEVGWGVLPLLLRQQGWGQVEWGGSHCHRSWGQEGWLLLLFRQ